MSLNIFLSIIVTSIATYLSRFLGVVSSVKINETSKIFRWLKKKKINDFEMLKTFNCGVGFCLIINPKKLNQIKSYFTNNYKPYVIGKITKNFKEKVKLNGSVNWI